MFPVCKFQGCLGSLNVCSLFAFGAGGDIKGNFLTLFQGFETFHIDGGEMGEQIFAAFVGSDETEALWRR